MVPLSRSAGTIPPPAGRPARLPTTLRDERRGESRLYITVRDTRAVVITFGDSGANGGWMTSRENCASR